MLNIYVKVRAAIEALRDEQGQDLVEYALLGALIAVAAVAALGTLAGKITTVLGTIGGDLT